MVENPYQPPVVDQCQSPDVPSRPKFGVEGLLFLFVGGAVALLGILLFVGMLSDKSDPNKGSDLFPFFMLFAISTPGVLSVVYAFYRSKVVLRLLLLLGGLWVLALALLIVAAPYLADRMNPQ